MCKETSVRGGYRPCESEKSGSEKSGKLSSKSGKSEKSELSFFHIVLI